MSGGMKNSDYAYAQMLEMMRSQGRKDNPTTIQIGIMQSSNSVKLDDLLLEAEDLYIADYLKAGYTRSASFSLDGVSKYSGFQFAGYLKKGDLVAVQKLPNNMYLILCRVVQA